MSTTQKMVRSAGVLLHPTSLPGPYGIGDLGPIAYEWVDVLAKAGQTWWQTLPLGPTGYGDSPYQCFSAFAGNPNLLSPELLQREGLLRKIEMPEGEFEAGRVDYEKVIPNKQRILTRVWENFEAGAGQHLRPAFEEFCHREASWLDDYAMFMALKDFHLGANWTTWSKELILRKPSALSRAKLTLASGIGHHKFGQFLFHQQWSNLRTYATEKGIKFIGDAPIFVSSDSADVWANPHLFLLDEDHLPTVVAGVPPDYFSATGQLWGNPHYDWAAMKKTSYKWWINRFKKTLEQVDLVRLDHFRGFEAYWEVPAENDTAENGRWVPGPGTDLLDTVREALGGLPLIAEDLGIITPEVEALRDHYNLPGMRILHFALSGSDNRFLPHHYERNTVVYPGTHDNDTTIGWYQTLPEHEKKFLHHYFPNIGGDIAWDLIRVCIASVADCAIIPMQDLLRLGSESRMNFPGKPSGNWQWRFVTGQITPEIIAGLADLTGLYSRGRSR